MIVVAGLALVVPGYLVAVALRAPFAWTAAFPLSALLIAETVMAYACIGIPLRFGTVLVAILIISALAFALSRFRARDPEWTAVPEPTHPALAVRWLLLIPVVAGLLGLALRTTLFPLSGLDTVFRWEALARLMLTDQGLGHYPPIGAADFALYSFPDGIPPLVSAIYWWLYSAWGEPFPALTAIAVVLQVTSIFALVFHAARLRFGSDAGYLAIALLMGSPLFLSGAVMGQETGFTALAVAGQVTFAWAAAVQRRPAGAILVAGLFAGLGALARDYGPFLSVCGLAIVAWQPQTRRYLPLFCLVVALSAGPWYVRNWIRTGNPVYSLGGELGLPVNPVYAGLIATYESVYGWHALSLANWASTARRLLVGAPLALLLGLPALVLCRKATSLAFGVLAVFALWFWSIPFTNGGIVYGLRVLTPAWALLAIAASALGCELLARVQARTQRRPTVLSVALAAVAGYGALCCWAHPAGPEALPRAVARTRADPLEFRDDLLLLVEELNKLGEPQGVLTDNQYLAAALQRRTRFRPVMIWSPEVAFIFDSELDVREVRRRLREHGVTLASWIYPSTHFDYLVHFPLLREGPDAWPVACSIPDVDPILSIPGP